MWYMAPRNGQSVFDLVTDCWRRKVTDGGNGAHQVTIPAEYHQKHDIEIGDVVAIKPADEQDGVLELHFK